MYAAVKGACEALGAASVAEDFGEAVTLRMHMDASAALGIIDRRGLCKMRHLDLNNIWLQEVEARQMLPAQKVPGVENCADLMTKHLNIAEITKYIGMMGLEFRKGRSGKTAELHNLQEGRKVGDSWDKRGVRGQWVRRHEGWRRTFFTPYKIEKGPRRDLKLESWRRTEGTWRSGGKFVIKDDWTDEAKSHRKLKEEWRGKTTFWQASTRYDASMTDGCDDDHNNDVRHRLTDNDYAPDRRSEGTAADKRKLHRGLAGDRTGSPREGCGGGAARRGELPRCGEASRAADQHGAGGSLTGGVGQLSEEHCRRADGPTSKPRWADMVSEDEQ